MLDLKDQLKKINEVLPIGAKVCLFDYPVHLNVGDMLIWKGTEQFFKESNIHVMQRWSFHLIDILLKRKDKLLTIPEKAIIVCHGGGNFGDLYFIHQNLRKTLVENFPNHRIVFLPQSIHFDNLNQMKKDFDLFSKHKDLHLFVRDKKSFQLASKYIKNVYLCPDIAHALYPIKSNSKLKSEGTLYFLRNDKEQSNLKIINSKSEIVNEFDWHILFTKLDMKIYKLFQRAHVSYKFQKIITPNLLSKLWFVYVNYIIKKAVKFFSGYKIIITSRLHGHILACLMNKDNQLIDNSYGKNLRYYECWTKNKSSSIFNG